MVVLKDSNITKFNIILLDYTHKAPTNAIDWKLSLQMLTKSTIDMF